MEALSSYSALMWLEKKKGVKAVDSVLEDYRDHLLAKDAQGRTVESAGPITWGPRLESTGIPDAWRSITYEKGAWIFHMLRRRLGDEQFMKMLAEMRQRYQFRTISTEDLRDLVEGVCARALRRFGVMDAIFDNWVLCDRDSRTEAEVHREGRRAGGEDFRDRSRRAEWTTIFQWSAGGDSVRQGAPQTIWVRSSNDGGTFSVTVKQVPSHVVLPRVC